MVDHLEEIMRNSFMQKFLRSSLFITNSSSNSFKNWCLNSWRILWKNLWRCRWRNFQNHSNLWEKKIKKIWTSSTNHQKIFWTNSWRFFLSNPLNPGILGETFEGGIPGVKQWLDKFLKESFEDFQKKNVGEIAKSISETVLE